MSYSSMKATKSSQKTTDIDFSVSKRTSKRASRAMRKSSIAWIAVLIVLVVGFVGGFFAQKYAFANDTYAMVGEDTIYIGGEEEISVYTEQGVKCIAFGKDHSNDCTVKYFYRTDISEEQVEVEDIDETKAGIYYAVYSTPASKYKSVTLIRNIIVLGEED